MNKIYVTVIILLTSVMASRSQGIISVSPSSAVAGQTLNVTITGSGTHFQSGSGSTLKFGFEQCSGTVVNSMNATSNTSLSASITIPTGVYNLTYDVEVYNFTDGYVVKDHAFDIGGGVVCPVSLSPDYGAPGQSLNVTITGTGTHFLQASSSSVKVQLDLDQTVCIASSNYFAGTPVNHTLMNCPFTIPPGTDTGYYDILIYDQVDTFGPLQNIFHVTTLTSVNEQENDNQLVISPNPFNMETFLNYSLSHAETICVEVYDLFGRKIFVENPGKKSPGSHVVKIDAAGLNLESGIYYLRFSSGNKSLTRKILLNR